MDGLKQYAAPFGYQLVERLSPRGRGFSLGVRARGCGVAGWGLCFACCWCRRCPAPPAPCPLALTLALTHPAVPSLSSNPPRPQTNRLIVLALTFLCYTAYHASRKPPSIVKSVLHGDAGGGDGARAWRPLGGSPACALGRLLGSVSPSPRR